MITGFHISATDPATGEQIGTCPDMGISDIPAVIEAATAAFESYRNTTAKQRHDLLLRFFELVKESSLDLANLIVLENGKSFADAKGEAA